MRNILLILGLSSLWLTSFSQTEDQVSFIEKNKDIAIAEMRKYCVPASITLAQAVLESASGNSYLAVRGKNFFGIKCKENWTGDTMLYHDDKANECFRKYPTVDSSFRDRSIFLKTRPNYANLFKLDKTDYKGWAHGLKKAGYATERDYDKKLIQIIELYKLDNYDKDLAPYDESGMYEHWPESHP